VTGRSSPDPHETNEYPICRALLETSSDAILVADLDGTIVTANERSARLFGFAGAQSIVGANGFDLVGPVGGKPLTKRRCLNGAAGLRDREHWLSDQDGVRIPVELSASVIRDEQGHPTGLLFMLHDETKLRRLEKEHRAIFEATGDGMVVYTMEGEIIDANPAFCAMNGYTCEELVGQNVAVLVHPDMQNLLWKFIQTVGSGESLRTHATNVRKDGSTFPVDVHGAVFEDQDGAIRILGVARDITEEVHALELLEQRVAERTRELLTVLGIAHDVASVLDLEPLLSLILDQLMLVSEYTWASIYRLEDDELVRLAGSGGDLGATGAASFPLTSVASLWEALRTGHSVIVDDLAGDHPLASVFRAIMEVHPEMGIAARARSWMLVPLVFQGRTVGAISILHERPSYYGDHHAQLAQAIADQAAIAMENARLYERAQQTAVLEERQRLARELHDAVTQTLFSASLIADVLPRLWARDQEAGMRRLEDVRALTRGALAEMRTLLLELRPAAIVEAELGDLLRQLAEVLYGRSRLPVTVAVEGQGELPADVQLAFYRVAQEALHNADKHAAAEHIEVRLKYGPRSIVLGVKDDGRGFDARASAEDGYAHFGLINMRERARTVGAAFTVRSQIGNGTEVRVQWNRVAKGDER
jgi:PAS domain S-box-containing protein